MSRRKAAQNVKAIERKALYACNANRVTVCRGTSPFVRCSALHTHCFCEPTTTPNTTLSVCVYVRT